MPDEAARGPRRARQGERPQLPALIRGRLHGKEDSWVLPVVRRIGSMTVHARNLPIPSACVRKIRNSSAKPPMSNSRLDATASRFIPASIRDLFDAQRWAEEGVG